MIFIRYSFLKNSKNILIQSLHLRTCLTEVVKLNGSYKLDNWKKANSKVTVYFYFQIANCNF